MFHNLCVEMTRARMTQGKLAKELGITQSTLSLKLNGKSGLSLEECIKIKEILKTELSIEELFISEDQKTKVG